MADSDIKSDGYNNITFVITEQETEETPQSNGNPVVNLSNEKCVSVSRGRLIKNLIVICLGFLFLSTTFQALANLQSTLNTEEGVGVASQSVIYGSLILSSMFVPSFLIKNLGCKRTIVLAILCFVPFIAANFYPHWGTLIPGGFVLGLGAAPLWSAKCTYLNEISIKYADIAQTAEDTIIVRFFGVFFMFFQSSQIWGNLISYYVLRPENETSFIVNSKDFNSSLCGSNFCNQIENEIFEQPEDWKVYMLIGIYLSTALCGALLTGLFLDPLERENVYYGKRLTGVRLLLATLKHLKNPRQLLLIPLTVYSGLEQAFFLSDYTKAYIACSWGIHRIGFVLICFGVVNAIFSLLSGPLVKLFTRLPIFIMGTIANLGVTITLLHWQPYPDQTTILLVLAGVWGLGDAIWQTQINALYGVLFKNDEEAAFSNYRLWESIGFSMAFAYSTYLCIDIKIYILLGFLSVGILGYLIIDIRTMCYYKGTFSIDH